MATKKQEIRRLIREDYGFPVLQNLLAELVYETQTTGGKDIEKRYSAILEIILGRPRKEIQKDGYQDDIKNLARAGVMTFACKITDKKTGKKRFLNAHEACREIARQDKLEGYTFLGKIPSTLTEGERQEIKSMEKRLYKKLKGKESLYAKTHASHVMEEDLFIETEFEEIFMVESMIGNWLSRYCVK